MERKDLIRGALVPFFVGLGIVAKTDSDDLDELHCSATAQSSNEIQEDLRGVDRTTVRVVDNEIFEKAKENLQTTLAWMKSLENLDIRESAACVQEEINETNFLISADNKRVAFVTVVPHPQRPQIVFSIKELSNGEFNRLEAAVDVFEAYHVYKRALEDPKRFTLDLATQLLSLEGEARIASSQVFSSIEQVDHN